jgi:hypothetical protein
MIKGPNGLLSYSCYFPLEATTDAENGDIGKEREETPFPSLLNGKPR